MASALLMAPRAPIYWDGFGYVAQALTGSRRRAGARAPAVRPGRRMGSPTDTWRRAGSVWSLEGALRTFMAAVSAPGPPGTPCPGAHAQVLAGHGRAGGAGAARGELAGVRAHEPAAVLTDAPAVTAILVACAIAAMRASRGSIPGALCGGGVASALAIAVGLREQ